MGQKCDKKAAYEEFFSSQDCCFNSLCTKICQLTILQSMLQLCYTKMNYLDNPHHPYGTPPPYP